MCEGSSWHSCEWASTTESGHVPFWGPANSAVAERWSRENRVSRVLLMGGIKKWAALWMCRGPDLNLGRGRARGRTTGSCRSLFPSCSSEPLQPSARLTSRCPSRPAKRGGGGRRGWKGRRGGKWMKTANHRQQPARRLTTGISRDPAVWIRTKAAVVAVVVGVVVDIVFDGRRIKLWASLAPVCPC